MHVYEQQARGSACHHIACTCIKHVQYSPTLVLPTACAPNTVCSCIPTSAGALGFPRAPPHAPAPYDSPVLKPVRPETAAFPAPCLSSLFPGSPGDATLPYEPQGAAFPPPFHHQAAASPVKPAATEQRPASSPVHLHLLSPSAQTQQFAPLSPLAHARAAAAAAAPAPTDPCIGASLLASVSPSVFGSARPSDPQDFSPPSCGTMGPGKSSPTGTAPAPGSRPAWHAPPLARKRYPNRRRSPATPTRSTPSMQGPPPWCQDSTSVASLLALQDDASRCARLRAWDSSRVA